MANPPDTQYQHYIPQFLLRNFSHPYTGPEAVKKKKKRRPKIDFSSLRLYLGDPAVHSLTLDSSPPKIVELPVKHIFGITNMYKYNGDNKLTRKEQNIVEEKLSKLEGKAAYIIKKFIAAQMKEIDTVSITREEKDTLRKFLFVMKYRSPIFFKRFNYQTPEGYISDDKHIFRPYMREKGFKRPLDVWLHNLCEIIGLDMSPGKNWREKLRTSIYPPDAEWFVIHYDTMYMAFATPSDQSDEFILTDNAFSVYEGPVSYSVDRETGRKIETCYTEFHVLNVVSPRLILLLRSTLLPEKNQDANSEVQKMRKLLLDVHMSLHSDPDSAIQSELSELPVLYPGNSYLKLVNGRTILRSSQDESPSKTDAFAYTIFQLPTKQTQLLNSVILDQASMACNIVFRTKKYLHKALAYYLRMATQTRGIYSMKTYTDEPNNPGLIFIKKIERFLPSQMEVKAQYHIDALKDTDRVNDGLSLPRSKPHTMLSFLSAIDSVDDTKDANKTSPQSYDTSRPHTTNSNGKDHESFLTDATSTNLLRNSSSTLSQDRPHPHTIFQDMDNDETTFEDAVLSVVQKATSLPNDPILQALRILFQTVRALDLTIPTIMSLDNQCADIEGGDFPIMIFNQIQFTALKNSSAIVKEVAEIPRHYWEYVWHALCNSPGCRPAASRKAPFINPKDTEAVLNEKPLHKQGGMACAAQIELLMDGLSAQTPPNGTCPPDQKKEKVSDGGPLSTPVIKAAEADASVKKQDSAAPQNDYPQGKQGADESFTDQRNQNVSANIQSSSLITTATIPGATRNEQGWSYTEVAIFLSLVFLWPWMNWVVLQKLYFTR